MNYWNMQLHPNDLGWTKEKELLEKHHLIGLGDWEEAAGQQPNFENTMAIGDYVLIKHGGDIIALTRIIGNYFYDENTDDLRWFQRCRQVEVLDWYKKDYDFKVSSRKALERYNENNNTEQLQSIKKWINMINIKTFIKENKDLLIANHNLILTGAPGTGKTYLAKQIAQQMIFGEIKEKMNPNEEKQFNEQCCFVQFHPSYDYTDFVEGLRPKEDNGNVVFKLQNGIFKAFCKKSLIPKLTKPVKDITIRITNYDLIYQQMLNSLKVGDEFKEKSGNLIRISKIDIENQTLTLFNSNNKEVVFTKEKLQKHIELYPTGKSLHNDHNNENITGNASVFWAVANYFYEYYYIHTLPFIFIIDEINRGEISKIFGELFYSIDPGYRGKDGKVRTQYANMQTTPNDFDKSLGITDSNDYGHFFVPENVYIIGTMNDIDRSVESMDFAFRRRFAFKEITAKYSKQMLDSDDAWGKDKMPKPDFLQKVKDKMNAINKVIFDDDDENVGIEGLSSAYHIGASYFLKLANYRNENGEYDETSFSDLWENHLEGLLLEYMRGMADVQKKIKKLANAYGYSKMNKYE